MFRTTSFSRRTLLSVSLVAVLALAASPSSAEVIENESVPFDGLQVPNPCNGELLTLEGSMHSVSRVTVSDDGSVIVGLSFNSHGVTATSTVSLPDESPAKYVTDETVEQTFIVHSDGPTVQTTTWNFEFIRTGEDGDLVCCGDDFKLHVTFHVTFLPDGTATAVVDHIDAECR